MHRNPCPVYFAQILSTYTYDALGRPTEVSHDDGQSIHYGYDNLGNRIGMRTEINDVVQSYVTYEHDSLNRITGVFDHDSAQVPANYLDWNKNGTVDPTEMQYNPLGQMTLIERPNDVDTSYVYGDAGIVDPVTGFGQNPHQVYSIVHENTESTPVTLGQYDYSYDPVGNRTGMDITASDGLETNITYEYDRANRMVSETYQLIGNATSTTEYAYDRAGNRTQMRHGDDITRYSYNANDELTRVDMPDYYFEDYTYDSRGNLTLVEAGGHGTYSATNYAYNARDQLISAKVPGTGTVTYDYDYLGNRVEQNVGGTVTNYLWDEFSRWKDVILETNPNDPLDVVSYTLANGMLISQNSAGNVDYFLQDAQGSTVGIADETGTVTSTYSYNAFGELDDSSTLETNYLYTGQQFDSETELYSLRARYYDSGIGRFMSRDTWAYDLAYPVELNRYVYTANNPATYADPSGYMLFSWSKLQENAVKMGSAAKEFFKKFTTPIFAGFWGGLLGYATGTAISSYLFGVDMPPGVNFGFGLLWGGLTGIMLELSGEVSQSQITKSLTNAPSQAINRALAKYGSIAQMMEAVRRHIQYVRIALVAFVSNAGSSFVAYASLNEKDPNEVERQVNDSIDKAENHILELLRDIFVVGITVAAVEVILFRVMNSIKAIPPTKPGIPVSPRALLGLTTISILTTTLNGIVGATVDNADHH